jgi:tRNA(His) 5'-end guanylyltransferase
MRKEYPLHEERRIENGWDIDLIWCPSQIIKTFTVNDKEYKIYLRWRFDDPWEIRINSDWLDMLILKEYQAEEYQELMNFIDDNIEEIIKEYEE